jgi:hypothetical protein
MQKGTATNSTVELVLHFPRLLRLQASQGGVKRDGPLCGVSVCVMHVMSVKMVMVVVVSMAVTLIK